MRIGNQTPTLAVTLPYSKSYGEEAVALLEQSLAQPNARTGECPGQHITALCADLRTLARRDVPAAGRYDLVCCNPPYFTGGAVSPKPGRAEARHQLTCTTADVTRTAAMLLKDGDLNIPEGMSEMEVGRAVAAMAAKNKVFSTVLRGAGAEFQNIIDIDFRSRYNSGIILFLDKMV